MTSAVRLWVDDERPAPDDTWKTAIPPEPGAKPLISDRANTWLSHWTLHGVPIEEISLDHDLGGDYDTGMRVLDYMIEHGIWPKTLTIHTANPPARENMLRAANAEAPDWVDIQIIHW